MSFDPCLSLYDEEVPAFLQEDLNDYGLHYDQDVLGDYSVHSPIWRQFQSIHGKVDIILKIKCIKTWIQRGVSSLLSNKFGKVNTYQVIIEIIRKNTEPNSRGGFHHWGERYAEQNKYSNNLCNILEGCRRLQKVPKRCPWRVQGM